MSFEADGYAVVRGFVPPQVWLPARKLLLDKVDGEYDRLGHFSSAIRLDPILLEIPHWLYGHGLIGLPRLHMPPMARFVRPGNLGAAVPPHRDTAYNKHMQCFLIVWLPMVEIDAKCGGMAVYPGSHLIKDIPTQLPKKGSGWLPGLHVDGLRREELWPLVPGDVVIMHENLVHESMPNLSDHTRLSLDYRFFSGPSSKPFIELGIASCSTSATASKSLH